MSARDTELEKRLRQLAMAPSLLVGCDYDGTLSPIVADPAQALPLPEGVHALRELASLPNTHVAVISGRALRDLASLLSVDREARPRDLHLVGSHGAEFDEAFASSLSSETLGLRETIRSQLQRIADAGPDAEARSAPKEGSGWPREISGFTIEEKPASIAFHYRKADPRQAERALQEVMDGPAALPGVFVKHGKKVVELALVNTSKGIALQNLMQRLKPAATIFLGDDITDEDAFAILKKSDIGIKIGEGETRAAFRINDPHEAAAMLKQLWESRARQTSKRQNVKTSK